MDNSDTVKSIKYAIEEYEELVTELDEMSEAWNSDDPCDQAENDPGLQFEIGVNDGNNSMLVSR